MGTGEGVERFRSGVEGGRDVVPFDGEGGVCGVECVADGAEGVGGGGGGVVGEGEEGVTGSLEAVESGLGCVESMMVVMVGWW